MEPPIKKGTLIFFCGKMGAGKSTKAKVIALEKNAVLLCEDEWLAAVYPNAITSLESYVHFSNQLKPQMKKLVQSILSTGTDVVMDFPANTLAQRDWFRRLFLEIEAPHHLLYIDSPDAVCLAHIAQRRLEQPERAKTDTAEMFAQVTQYFVAPTDAEGFHITRLQQKAK